MLHDQLSAHESLVWLHLSGGFTYDEISAKTGIPRGRVQTILKGLYRKLSVRNRAEAAVRYLKVTGAISN